MITNITIFITVLSMYSCISDKKIKDLTDNQSIEQYNCEHTMYLVMDSILHVQFGEEEFKKRVNDSLYITVLIQHDSFQDVSDLRIVRTNLKDQKLIDTIQILYKRKYVPCIGFDNPKYSQGFPSRLVFKYTPYLKPDWYR